MLSFTDNSLCKLYGDKFDYLLKHINSIIYRTSYQILFISNINKKELMMIENNQNKSHRYWLLLAKIKLLSSIMVVSEDNIFRCL